MELAGVELTSPDRVLYRGQGITKRELAEYYVAVAPHLLPQLEARPLTLIRCPRGQGEPCFVQRRASDQFPDFVGRVEVEVEAESAEHLMVESLRALVYMAQIGVLELHVWGSRRDRLERPDRMILDLDPDEGLAWDRIVEAAVAVRDRLDDAGLRGFVKTSGGKGLHVVVPLVRRHSWDAVRAAARALAEGLERDAPERYVADASKAQREGRVFIDYLRNAWAASAVAAFSPRARPGAPVSAPVAWAELDGIRPDQLNVRTVPERLRAGGAAAWEGFDEARRQSLTRAALRRLGA